MELVRGKYAEAKVYSDDMGQYARAQVQMICDNEASIGSRIRVMPDVHPGKVGPIGLTMTITDRILPSLVGIDIGCGLRLVELEKYRHEFRKLDVVIRERIPSGFAIHGLCKDLNENLGLEELFCFRHIDRDRANSSLGTLGGGNHFIEIDMDEEKNVYLAIHTGSRHLGKEVADFYMKEGQKRIKERGEDIPYEMTYIEDDLKDAYLHDIKIVQQFAAFNRARIASEIIRGMKWEAGKSFSCTHNYISEENGEYLLRKGAISARKGEEVVIPVNMRDGIIFGEGKGENEWNNSAPHGSGRIKSREQARNNHTLSEFKKTMGGIYSPSIAKVTLDEAPFAYRSLNQIIGIIKETVEINRILRPVYNYKAGGDKR